MKMLICTLGSTRREMTLHYSGLVARGLAADTTLLGVVEYPYKIPDLEAVLREKAAQFAADGLTVRVQVEAGDGEGIVMAELARSQYDLVAVGTLGERRSRRKFLNSVGMRIVERAESSVLLVKEARRDLSRMLICSSGTEAGQAAIQAGAMLACGTGARPTILHIVDPMPAMYTGLEQMEETLAEMLQSESEKARALMAAVQTVDATCTDSELKLRRGIVADEILLEAAEGDHDLIVMGSSRVGTGLVRVLMGDLTREICVRSHRPVLVVRPGNGAVLGT